MYDGVKQCMVRGTIHKLSITCANYAMEGAYLFAGHGRDKESPRRDVPDDGSGEGDAIGDGVLPGSRWRLWREGRARCHWRGRGVGVLFIGRQGRGDVMR